MTQALKDEALEQIEMDIAFGFENPNELSDSILDMFYQEEDFDQEWLRTTINDKYQEHLRQSQSWTRPTDFDRLATAFDQLIAQGIVCLHKAGYTRQDGIGDCEETIDQLKTLGIQVKGFCFYHTQDLTRAIQPENPNLLLGYDGVGQDAETAIAVANAIVRALKENGFSINWSGDINERIEINPIHWQKVPDNQHWGAQRVIKILAEKPRKKKPFWKFWR